MKTSHGHYIPGTVHTEEDLRVRQVARCGGPAICVECSHQAMQAILDHTKEKQMSVQTNTYVRKPFEVEAVEVTETNMEAITEWCNGQLVSPPNGKAFIKVHVARALNERQTKAYPGDWVLYAGTGFKVYTEKAFRKTFEPVHGITQTTDE